MKNLREIKQELRQGMLARRRERTTDEIAAGSSRIAEHLLKWPLYQTAKTVMLYLAMPDEPQTDAILAHALRSGKTVAVPMLRKEYGLMDAARIRGPEDLITGRLGLRMPDPAKAEIIEPSAFDLIIVPGVAFDLSGNRLGMGAGYYDRFLPLADCATSIGAAWSFQIAPSVPRGQYDVPMQYLLTEGGVQSCAGGVSRT